MCVLSSSKDNRMGPHGTFEVQKKVANYITVSLLYPTLQHLVRSWRNKYPISDVVRSIAGITTVQAVHLLRFRQSKPQTIQIIAITRALYSASKVTLVSSFKKVLEAQQRPQVLCNVLARYARCTAEGMGEPYALAAGPG